jgi:hypothetical protein
LQHESIAQLAAKLLEADLTGLFAQLQNQFATGDRNPEGEPCWQQVARSWGVRH